MIKPYVVIFVLNFINLIDCDITKATIGNNITNCNHTFTNFKTEKIKVDDYCKKKACFVKCCPQDEIITLSRRNIFCDKIKDMDKDAVMSNFTTMHNIYDKHTASYKTLKDYNVINIQKFDPNDTSCHEYIKYKNTKYLIAEDGSLFMERPNYFIRWAVERNKLEYCIDIARYKNRSNPTYKAFILMNRDTNPIENEINNKRNILSKFTAYSMMVSCFFFMLVLIVYLLLPRKSIVEMILMAYVASLLVAYMLQALDEILGKYITTDHCKMFSPILYYAILSSFFWLNILSFDIWWTFRGTRKQRQIHRRGHLVKFLWYCLYAWGKSGVMVIGAIIIDRSDLKNWPAFIKPWFEDCLANKYETLLYLYIPILILIVINCTLFIMTSYNIWIIDRTVSKFKDNNSSNTSNRNRFRVYTGLSLFMGVSWVLEMIQAFAFITDKQSIAVHVLLDLFNVFIGVIIFFMFVCKKEVWRKITKRIGIENSNKKYGVENLSSTSNLKSSINVKTNDPVATTKVTDTTTV